MTDAEKVCAYCGEAVLTGKEKPEHPIPHALGSSLVVFTVCDPCNEWASRNVDQPFLSDDWTRIHRALHGVRDPRRPGTPMPHPLLQGFTEDGVRVTTDQDGRPQLGSLIVEDKDDPDLVHIHAGSVEESRRLMERIAKKAAAEGKKIEIVREERAQVRPKVHNTVKVNIRIWLKATAKMALGIASAVYPPEWRLSEDAIHLRHLMRSDDPRSRDGEPIVGLTPTRVETDDLLSKLAEPPEHVVWFVRGYDDATRVFLMLFGELMLPMTVDTTGQPTPKVAWRLDPAHPRRDGRTTFDGLMISMIERLPPEDGPDPTH